MTSSHFNYAFGNLPKEEQERLKRSLNVINKALGLPIEQGETK